MSHKIICIKVKDICSVYFLVNQILKTLHIIHHVNKKKKVPIDQSSKPLQETCYSC